MGPEITLELLLIMLLVGVVAGWVDAIAGGGGLVALPALLFTGVTPLEALATNKLQGTFGSFTAAANYTRRGWVDLRSVRWLVLGSLLGSTAGTVLVQSMSLVLVERLLPILLGVMALYFLVAPGFTDAERRPRLDNRGYACTAAPTIGFYDGFFGPGTGSLFTLSAVTLLGASATRAVGLTKVLNFASNIASVTVFLVGGHMVWTIGIAMIAGQAFGAWLGSGMAIRGGVRLIRPIVVIVCLGMMGRLLYQQYVV